MILYRLQNYDGDGPFQSEGPLNAFDVWNSWRREYIAGSVNHPGPYQDGLEKYLRKFPNNWKFACPSTEMIVHWFNPLLPFLDAMRFHIVKIYIDEEHVVVSDSKTQCIYMTDKVKSERTITC